ncbi:MAG: tetratricopeptide repeat protein [bacterium]|nr:MAG: tetratricopeptide repeat protein [bacterium]
MKETTKGAITGAIITAWPSILVILFNHLYSKISLILFTGIIISYTLLFALIVLHLWKPEYFRTKKSKKILYLSPVVIFFISATMSVILKPPLPKFTGEEFGILVANFNGETEETRRQGKEIKSAIVSDLEKEFRHQETEIDVRIEPLNEAIIPNTGEAKIWGAKYNANIVLYGRITGGTGEKAQIFPWLTIVDSIIIKEIYRTDIFMGKYLFDWDEIQLPPAVIKNTRILYMLTVALIYQSEKQFDKAEEKLERIIGIINLQDTLAIKHHFLGNLYLSQVRDSTLEGVNQDSLLGLAEQEYISSMTKNPTYHNSYFGLGYLLAEMKQRPDSAIAYFEKARELQQGNYKYNWNLAQAYLQTNQLDKAHDIIKTYLHDHTEIERANKNEMKKLLKTIEELKKVISYEK